MIKVVLDLGGVCHREALYLIKTADTVKNKVSVLFVKTPDTKTHIEQIFECYLVESICSKFLTNTLALPRAHTSYDNFVFNTIKKTELYELISINFQTFLLSLQNISSFLQRNFKQNMRLEGGSASFQLALVLIYLGLGAMVEGHHPP